MAPTCQPDGTVMVVPTVLACESNGLFATNVPNLFRQGIPQSIPPVFTSRMASAISSL